MEYDFELKKFTEKFYIDRNKNSWHEVLEKKERVYNCVVIDTFYDFLICLPFRSDMSHKYGYRFKESSRSKLTKSGIDFTKMILLENDNYLSDGIALIDKDEYNEFMKNSNIIISDAIDYLNDYIKYKNGDCQPSLQESHRKFKYSSLKHFDYILKKYKYIS